MNRRLLIILGVIVIVVIVAIVLFTQFITVQDAGAVDIDVAAGSAQSADITIDIPVANLDIGGGATQLADGSIVFPLPGIQPQSVYAVQGDQGTLNIRQDAFDVNLLTDTSTLNFNNDTPINLILRRTAGTTNLDLSPLSVGTVSGNTGSGDDTVLLEGSHPTLTDVAMQLNEGADVWTMNCDCPSLLSVTLDNGAGSDTVSVSGAYNALGQFTLQGGADSDTVTIGGSYPLLVSSLIALGGGDDRLTLNGDFAPNTNLIINIGTGNDLVTLGDEWGQSSNITLISEGDTAALEVPSAIGVRIEIASRGNTVNAEGFTQQDAAYVNEAFGTSEVTLNININTTPNETITITQR